ncbi:MAG: DUF1566 domain-containing protein [Patescibacteria group bacterium]
MKKNVLVNLIFPLLAIGIVVGLGAVLVQNTQAKPTIAATKSGSSLYSSQNTPFTAEFGSNENPGQIAFKARDTNLTFTLPYSDLSWEKKEGKLSATAGDKEYRYMLIQNDEKQAIGIKEEIILQSPPEENTFSFAIDLQGLTPRKLPVTTAQNEKVEIWRFFDLQEREVFYIPEPFMEDTAGAISKKVDIAIEGNTLTITADREWLDNPARVYPVTIDPSFVLTVLTLHSHPREGTEWKVEFVTQGKSDLKIIPDDQATIDDMDFVSLKCGDETRDVHTLSGDVISYPNWECDQVAEVSHVINKERNHRLKFEFAGLTAYAYNAGLDPDGSPSDTMVTLEDIYYKMQSSGTAGNYGLEATEELSTSMYTLQQIYDAAPDFNSAPGTATAGDVCNSATFYTDSSSPLTGNRTACFEEATTGLPDTGQTTCYNASTSISCGSADFPGQDADYTINAPSYTQNTYTVNDNVTGFEWQRYGHGSSDGYTVPSAAGNCATGGSYSSGYCTYSWQNALKYCANLNMDGKTDWRLPNVKELTSIVHYSTYNPSINTSYFSNTASNYYWSSTTYSGNNTGAWYVSFGNGHTDYYYKPNSYRVRCVRGE